MRHKTKTIIIIGAFILSFIFHIMSFIEQSNSQKERIRLNTEIEKLKNETSMLRNVCKLPNHKNKMKILTKQRKK